MTRLRKYSLLAAASLGLLLFACPASVRADEKTIALKGHVDVSGLGISSGRFRVRALRPQNRSIELGKITTDTSGRFSLTVEDEAVGVYGVVLEATSDKQPSLVLEAVALRIREAKEPIAVTPATTVETAILAWKIRQDGQELDLVRPNFLYVWLRPLLLPKTRKGLKRAKLALTKWARSAAKGDSLTTASILKASVGDLRSLRERLKALNVPPKAIDEIEQMTRSDTEVAYILMVPYLLEL